MMISFINSKGGYFERGVCWAGGRYAIVSFMLGVLGGGPGAKGGGKGRKCVVRVCGLSFAGCCFGDGVDDGDGDDDDEPQFISGFICTG